MTATTDDTPATATAKVNLLPAKIIYGLYALGYFTLVTALAGVIYAYVARSDASEKYLNSHLAFQIRTFWKGLLMLGGALAAAATVIGYPIAIALLVFWLIWSVARLVSGLNLALKGAPVAAVGALGLLAR